MAQTFLASILERQKPVWMGILNVTPDSFSDGGSFNTEEAAVKRAHDLVKHGATVIDVGGASTRPGSAEVSPELELSRVFPVLHRLRKELPKQILLSIDTFQPSVAATLAEQGLVDILNDVYAGRYPGSISTIQVAAHHHLALVVMHMQGVPGSMQDNPSYSDCNAEVVAWLSERARTAQTAGVKTIVIDPGIGFGKRLEHNLSLLSSEGIFSLKSLGFPLLIGLSRKRFLAEYYKREGFDLSLPASRDEKTKIWEQQVLKAGADIIRSHKLPSEVKFP